MRIRVFRDDHPEVREVIASNHCVQRFRERRGIREAGVAAVGEPLARAFEDADFTRWAPPWAATDTRTELWAMSGDLAFPLRRAAGNGSWLALTCLARPKR
jgi:hypothetical protein